MGGWLGHQDRPLFINPAGQPKMESSFKTVCIIGLGKRRETEMGAKKEREREGERRGKWCERANFSAPEPLGPKRD